MIKHMVKYYHIDGGETLESYISNDALEAFIKVLLTTGYRILEIA